jgi:hypothetical protein
MLTGSMAMNYYVEPRMTRDLDMIIDIYTKDIYTLFEKFKDEYYISKEAFQEAYENKTSFNIIHTKAIVKIDFMIRDLTGYRGVEFNRRQKVKINDAEIDIVSKEDLIISKLIWAKDSHSQMQKKDIINLLESDFDKQYLSSWLKKLNLEDFFEEFIDARYLK